MKTAFVKFEPIWFMRDKITDIGVYTKVSQKIQ